MYVHVFTTVWFVQCVRHFNVFESLLYSQRLHLFDKKNCGKIIAFLNDCFLFEYILKCNLFL